MTVDRRDFIFAGLGLAATAGLPAFGRGRYEQLNVAHVRIAAGAERPFSVLHVSDTHLTLAGDDEPESLRRTAASRADVFGGRQLEALETTVEWARHNVDYLVHTGDLVDFVSAANLAAVRRCLGGAAAAFGCMGNHEFTPSAGAKDAAERRRAFRDRLADAFPYDPSFAACVVNGVNFVAMDDVFDDVAPELATRFEAEARKGLPIVLLVHVPFRTPLVAAGNDKYWSWDRKFRNDPVPFRRGFWLCEKSSDRDTADFIRYLKSEKQLKGILAGHFHFSVQDRFSPTAMEYVVGGNYGFVAQEVQIV